MDWMLFFFRCGRLFGFLSCHFQLPPPQLSPSPLIASLFCVASAVRSLSGYCLILILTLTFFKLAKQIFQKVQKKLLWFAFVKYYISSLRYITVDFYTLAKSGGVELQGPLWAPKRLFPNLITLAFVLIVPILYGAIYSFRRKHATTMLGSSLRKRRNITHSKGAKSQRV